MKKENEQTIYVYTKGTTRFAYLNPLSEFEMAMNGMVIADFIQVENGLAWFNEVNEHAEALIKLMRRTDRNEAVEWVNYLFDTMKVENKEVINDKKQRCWFMEDIENLSNKKKLTKEEEDQLEYALSILEINIDEYGFNTETGEFGELQ